jgi:transcriptional regulator with XRE-family HTH domain
LLTVLAQTFVREALTPFRKVIYKCISIRIEEGDGRMPRQKGGETLTARRGARQQRTLESLNGLRACRIAAVLTQKELADLAGTSQTTIADLERWEGADLRLLQQLCEALNVAPEDLIYPGSVNDEALEATQAARARYGFGDGDAQLRHQINRIKRRARYTPAPGTVLLRGLKERRMAAGLSQRALAKMISTNQSTIAELEKGIRRGAYMSTLRKLCHALEATPADLICR